MWVICKEQSIVGKGKQICRKVKDKHEMTDKGLIARLCPLRKKPCETFQ